MEMQFSVGVVICIGLDSFSAYLFFSTWIWTDFVRSYLRFPTSTCSEGVNFMIQNSKVPCIPSYGRLLTEYNVTKNQNDW